MNKYFIYFSETGNGDIVAEKLASYDYKIVKVEMKRPLAKKFFFKVMQGGFLASIHAKSKIKELDVNISLEDEVVIGSPIWNGRISSPINTVLNDYEFINPTFIFYSGGGDAKGALKYLSKHYKASKAIVLKEPKKNEEELEKLKEIL